MNKIRNHFPELPFSLPQFMPDNPPLEMRQRKVVLKRQEEELPWTDTTNSSYTIRTVRYGECQKNHAANVGGYALDGCREFMAAGEEETSGALTCAACGCHRNFHRRVVETEVVSDHSTANGS